MGSAHGGHGAAGHDRDVDGDDGARGADDGRCICNSYGRRGAAGVTTVAVMEREAPAMGGL